MFEKESGEVMSEKIQYKRIVDGMAKHIVHGNII